MGWDAGFSGGLQDMPPPEAGMSLWEYLIMLAMAAAVTGIRQALEIVGKNIDDEQTGWKGIVRDICKALSGYVKNKEHPDKPKEPES